MEELEHVLLSVSLRRSLEYERSLTFFYVRTKHLECCWLYAVEANCGQRSADASQ